MFKQTISSIRKFFKEAFKVFVEGWEKLKNDDDWDDNLLFQESKMKKNKKAEDLLKKFQEKKITKEQYISKMLEIKRSGEIDDESYSRYVGIVFKWVQLLMGEVC